VTPGALLQAIREASPAELTASEELARELIATGTCRPFDRSGRCAAHGMRMCLLCYPSGEILLEIT
jgi:hypothetical protein